MTEPPKPSKLETIKEQSQYLLGRIPEELVDGSDHFGSASIQLLKHHGTYQQDDRDLRKAARKAGEGKAYMFMVRTRLPGGRLTSDQLLAELEIADKYANQTLRITSRQGLQLHGVLKDHLADTIGEINRAQLTTLGACGDVNRNTMCCPAPYHDQVHQQMQQLADTLAEHLAPRSAAYHTIWLTDQETGEKQQVAASDYGPGGDDVEPLYGKHYMPRKFKIGVALPHDNCIDIYTHDLGMLAIVEDDRIIGYNVLVGGGMGVTPSAKKTFPALGRKLCFVLPDEAVAIATAVVRVQRDFGNRSDRKVARLKYLVANWGIEKFREQVAEYYGKPLTLPTEHDVEEHDDHMGWEPQGNGRWFYGLNVENGRILDNDQIQLKSALRAICRKFQPGIRLTAHQSLILTDIEEPQKGEIEQILRDHHVPLTADVSNARRWSMACVAWPTCGLSITESERALPGMLDQLESALDALGLGAEKFTLRMTGCPNGCARPYNSDIGIVGKAAEKYTLFLGGRRMGNRLNWIYKDLVPADEVVCELVTLFTYFKQDRQVGESFGDFCDRRGKDDLIAWCDGHAE